MYLSCMCIDKELFISIVPVRNVSKKKKFFCQISSRSS